MTTIEGTSTNIATRREMCVPAITTTTRIATIGLDRSLESHRRGPVRHQAASAASLGLVCRFQLIHDKLESFENGPIDVQVFGNVAVAHGSVSEQRIRDDKSVSGDFVWMDLLEKRAGKWQVVRSAGSKVK